MLKFLDDPGDDYLVQSIENQTLYVCRRGVIDKEYKASTSVFGCGTRENSYKTPLGIHRIRDKIGAGAPPGRIFKGRIDTGVDWDGHSGEENLILTRILRLEGMEDGINRGSGVDSYGRYIYIHGTNREDMLGTPLSHGCIALGNNDIIELFDIVREGTLLYVDPYPIAICGKNCKSIHFTGIFGTGMSALAQYVRFQGITVSGSDRQLTNEDTASIRLSLENLDCAVFGQDGSGISTDTDIVCISTAIEDSNPDISAARALDIPIVHRSDLLAAVVLSRKTIAVAGTSGKSTVTAMIFEFLTKCGKSPSLISGAPLRRLEKQGLIGNAFAGGSDLLVVEADESDGTIVKYSPEISVILNISKDHKEIGELTRLFETLMLNSNLTVVNADDPILLSMSAATNFGRNPAASWRPDRVEIASDSVKLFRGGIEFYLPLPGQHNLENLMAALCVCEHFDCSGTTLSDAASTFEGVARRFSVIKTVKDVYIVDDYAHNPAKIKAVVSAARWLSKRVIAVYQPHGFGPTRFLKDEYVSTFRAVFEPTDSLYLLPIYYAGGTARKDIASEDIVAALNPVSFNAKAVSNRDELLKCLEIDVKEGDCVLVMGARDPSLPSLVKKITDLFDGATVEPSAV